MTFGENGIMEHIGKMFSEYNIGYRANRSFTLQNGEEKLKSCFSDVRRFLYEDSLEVTSAEDMADYIRSLSGMSGLREIPADEMRSVLERNMRGGILRVPKEYGMFVARN